jgi:hypothetical protein
MHTCRFQVRRLIACILLPTYLAACTSWKTQEVSPQQVLADKQPDKVRVELADGSRFVVEEPVVSGDTLMGFEKGRWTSGRHVPGDEVSIPLSDIEHVAVRGTDIGLTVGVTILGLLVAAGVAVLAVCSSEGVYC